jgi:hypothetical protein
MPFAFSEHLRGFLWTLVAPLVIAQILQEPLCGQAQVRIQFFQPSSYSPLYFSSVQAITEKLRTFEVRKFRFNFKKKNLLVGTLSLMMVVSSVKGVLLYVCWILRKRL